MLPAPKAGLHPLRDPGTSSRSCHGPCHEGRARGEPSRASHDGAFRVRGEASEGPGGRSHPAHEDRGARGLGGGAPRGLAVEATSSCSHTAPVGGVNESADSVTSPAAALSPSEQCPVGFLRPVGASSGRHRAPRPAASSGPPPALTVQPPAVPSHSLCGTSVASAPRNRSARMIQQTRTADHYQLLGALQPGRGAFPGGIGQPRRAARAEHRATPAATRHAPRPDDDETDAFHRRHVLGGTTRTASPGSTSGACAKRGSSWSARPASSIAARPSACASRSELPSATDAPTHQPVPLTDARSGSVRLTAPRRWGCKLTIMCPSGPFVQGFRVACRHPGW